MMTQKNLFLIFVVLCIALVVEIVVVRSTNKSKPAEIIRKSELLCKKLDIEYKQKKRDVEIDYKQKRYVASGKTAYDRIFNAKQDTPEALIKELATEAFPPEWKTEVRVEEFTHFILLVHIPYEAGAIPFEQLEIKLNNVQPYLVFLSLNIAIFDKYHKCSLFFDESDINTFHNGSLSATQIETLKERGRKFTKFNSITVVCEKAEGHLFVPIDITGNKGYETCYALLDTGASVTVLSKKLIQKTGDEILDRMQTRQFETANGLIVCPIVHRELDLAGFRKNIDVAVGVNEEQNLLGMNYFKGLQYIIDPQYSCIYLWSE